MADTELDGVVRACEEALLAEAPRPGAAPRSAQAFLARVPADSLAGCAPQLAARAAADAVAAGPSRFCRRGRAADTQARKHSHQP